jgi:acyl-CoA synthetase (AMP-forming)/AMP-acid ligase II
MTPPAGFTETLLRRAGERPDHDAVVVTEGASHRPGGRAAERVPYGLLDRRARAVAAWLQRHDAAGDTVLVSADPGPWQAAALLGCLYAGAVAVPVAVPGRSRIETGRTAAVAKDAAVRIVLCEAEHATAISRELALGGRTGLLCLAIDADLPESARDWRPPRLAAGDLALLSYSSGTAESPRGVMVTHGGLNAAMETMRERLGTGLGSRIGGCQDGHQDPGPVAFPLHPLWLGATAVTLPSQGRSDWPGRWLNAVSRSRVTVTLAPDGVYARCAADLPDGEPGDLDLSRWECAAVAGGPVRAATLTAFARRFAGTGLRDTALTACYGRAEASPVVTAGRPWPDGIRTVDAAGLAGGALRPPAAGAAVSRLVSRGVVDTEEVCVTDVSTSAVLPEGTVGEIWVRGPGVAAGYWRRPLESSAVFRRVAADGARPFVRTGDLGVLDAGHLYVTGRAREELPLDGRLLHPQDVERELQSQGGPFLASSVFAAGPESRVVVVQEIRVTEMRGRLPALADRVRRCVSDEFGVVPAGVLLVRPGTVRRSSSGKLGRPALRELFLRDELRALYAELTADGEYDVPISSQDLHTYVHTRSQ